MLNTDGQHFPMINEVFTNTTDFKPGLPQPTETNIHLFQEDN